jgi:hypothetical protein
LFVVVVGILLFLLVGCNDSEYKFPYQTLDEAIESISTIYEVAEIIHVERALDHVMVLFLTPAFDGVNVPAIAVFQGSDEKGWGGGPEGFTYNPSDNHRTIDSQVAVLPSN